MTVEEKFYLVLMDEIRSQPDLVDDLPFELESHAELFAGCPLDVAINRLQKRRPCAGGLGFGAVAKLPPQPAELVRGLEELRSQIGEDQLTSYTALCRAALLNLLWRDFQQAEQRINLAKYLRDEWAFAHFIYGLLRGIDGDVGKAHFELYLAVNREGLICARNRIDRALGLVR
jgi:hypothetical protein